MNDTPVSSLAEARFNRDPRPDSHQICDMLRVAIARIERGEIEPDHVILCFGKVDADRVCDTAFLQAGDFSLFEQIGLLSRVSLNLARPA